MEGTVDTGKVDGRFPDRTESSHDFTEGLADAENVDERSSGRTEC